VFLLVPAHSGSPGQRAVKWLLLLLLHGRRVEDFLARSLNKEDAVDHGRWKKLIKIG